ncbi:MAG TPA: alpha/beta fold hydrolase [Ensifer sp.]|nr:alpha/beta fold hydrolase [Ensifer sp.]
MRKWTLVLIGFVLILAGAVVAHMTRTDGGIKVKDVRFATPSGTVMSAFLYIPPNATAKTPAPGILAVHGYVNSRETQDGFAIEFARRGYVVLEMDQRGHGYSDGPAFADGFGGPAGLAYLRTFDFVDKANIGLEGHSMGGWTVLAAAAAMPNDYKAIVLEGSSTGAPFAKEGTPDWPRNLGLVYSKYDEFSQFMWGIHRPVDIVTGPKLQAVFGSTDIKVGQLYGDIAAGTGRMLYQPATTHAGDHMSRAAIGDAIDWFSKTLVGGTPKPADDQIWYNKEFATLAILLGLMVLSLGIFDVALGLPAFASLKAEPQPARPSRNGGWWVAFLIATIVPAIAYFPLTGVGYTSVGAQPWLPQQLTNAFVTWALGVAVVSLILQLVLKGKGAEFNNRIWASLGIAVLTVLGVYGALALVGAAYGVDARFWIVALKLMSATQMKIFAIYLIPFTVFFLIALRSMHATLSIREQSAFGQYAWNALSFVLGLAVLLAGFYIAIWTTGGLPIPDLALFLIVGIPFVPVLAFVAIFSTFAWRRTNSYLPGALFAGLFVTWFVVAGQATQAPF